MPLINICRHSDGQFSGTKKEPAAIAPDSLGSSQILVTQAETLDEFTVTNDIGLAQVGKKVTTLTNLLQKTNI